jgi:fused signal recognition particle receptor
MWTIGCDGLKQPIPNVIIFIMKNPFEKWMRGLEKTRDSAFHAIKKIITVSDITEDTLNELENLFIQADMGMETSQAVITNLRAKIKSKGIVSHDEFEQVLEDELITRLITASDIDLKEYNPAVIMIVGVNGSGKTTTIAKLANYYKNNGRKVLLAAADTFRAAADEQLNHWAEKIDIPVVVGEQGSDPGAVVYNAIQAALSRKKDLVIIDTAGRLHTRHNLMEELKKIQRVAGKAFSGAPHACWLVIDAITGQNGLSQAEVFKKTVNINGVILAKLDLSAKGGIAFSIMDKLKLPILFAGLGEGINDFEVFSPQAFIKGIIST